MKRAVAKRNSRFRNVRAAIRRRLNILHFRFSKSEPRTPSFAKKQLHRKGYFSQYGQGKWVYENLTRGKRKGIFVDIGAYDGITLSNTYFMEQIEWSGLAIEPNPTAYQQLVINRSCRAINGCIAAQSGKQVFRQITGAAAMLSGLVEDYDARHLYRIESETNESGGAYTEIEVDCYTLNELLRAHAITKVDYLTIDVEGAELKILESIDFNEVEISIIGVENNYGDERIKQLLSKKGFDLHSTIDVDVFYVNRSPTSQPPEN